MEDISIVFLNFEGRNVNYWSRHNNDLWQSLIDKYSIIPKEENEIIIKPNTIYITYVDLPIKYFTYINRVVFLSRPHHLEDIEGYDFAALNYSKRNFNYEYPEFRGYTIAAKLANLYYTELYQNENICRVGGKK